MTRQQIYDAVKTVLTPYWVGQHVGVCNAPYVVIKFAEQSMSLNNGGAGWQVFDIMVYVPKASIAPVDGYLDRINAVLQAIGAEPTGNRTADYLDLEVEAIMRSEQYRIPKQIN